MANKVLGSVGKFFASLFRRAAPKIRDGALEFLDAVFTKALKIAERVILAGGYATPTELAKAIFDALKAEFPSTPDGWLDLLKAHLVEHFKALLVEKSGRKSVSLLEWARYF